MDFFTFTPQFKLLIAGNHKPGLRNVDEAIRRRFNLLPFDFKISVGDQDPDLPEKLKFEYPGILQWMVDGCRLWQEHGLAPPGVIADATRNYFEAEDGLATWMTEYCSVSKYSEAECSMLFTSWRKWSSAAGEEPGSQKRFSQALEARGFERKRVTGGKAAFKGIDLRVRPSRAEPAHERE